MKVFCVCVKTTLTIIHVCIRLGRRKLNTYYKENVFRIEFLHNGCLFFDCLFDGGYFIKAHIVVNVYVE
jgi:hypothetical protein